MSMTNEDLIISFLEQSYSDPEIDTKVTHGNMSYKNNILYSYSYPIAMKFKKTNGHIVLIHVNEGNVSVTTSRQIYDLKKHIYRFFDENSVVRVNVLADYIDKRDYTFDFAAFIAAKIKNILAYADEPISVFAYGYRREEMQSALNAVYDMAPIVYLADIIDYGESIIKQFNSPLKISQLEAENKRIEKEKRAKDKEDALQLIMSSKDFLFDLMCSYNHANFYYNDKKKFHTSAMGKHASKVAKGFEELGYDGREVLNSATGYSFSYSRYGTLDDNADNVHEDLKPVSLSISKRHKNYSTGVGAISISSLVRVVGEDGINYPAHVYGNAGTGGSEDITLELCPDGYIALIGRYTGDMTRSRSRLPSSVMDLIIKFVHTLREKGLAK